MGLVDRWIKKFLGVEDGAAAALATTDDDAPPVVQALPEVPLAAAVAEDPLDAHIKRARGRLTVDREGRRYAESVDFQGELKSLDGGGRRKAADDLLADALLCTPSLSLRRQLAERLLHRGDRQRARGLLERLSSDDEHAAFALTALGELAEAEGAIDDALRAYERVLAIDISLAQPKARARRLRNDAERAQPADNRATLARFLGTRAAGARYAVVDEIGRGGAATVFRARDRHIGRDVALKIYHPRGNREDRRRRLIEEARVAGAFDHPHVVPVLGLDEDRDLLVMMLCDGGSLQRSIQTQGKLGARQAVELGAVLLRTLADIHDAGHLHLDIKPSNLLLHEGRLMVCDFGTAGLKELGASAGTRAYMAPEHLRNTADAGAPSDLYAAGLVVAEMIEGRLARRGEVVLPTLSPGPRRRGLERVLSMLTANDPAERPADGRVAAQLLLEAGALPQGDAEGSQLASQIDRLARQAGDDAVARLQAHPLVPALRG